ncbi:MAG: hypothetical protein M1817_006616 [Caeruleum heppii]|nr:MAG: hypothetical protein M1817_006616 [Caeruleum heppii]
MAPTARMVVRDDSPSTSDGLNPTMINLLIVLLVLVFVGLLSVTALYFLRNHRKSKRAGLPKHNSRQSGSKTSNHRRLTITATPYGRNSRSLHVFNEKQNLVDNSSSPPLSPDSIPEIRITFPEEEDEGGQRKSGRVVVVRVGETGVGLEPLNDESLPPYQKSDADRFQSLDLERIGGLQEKEHDRRWS